MEPPSPYISAIETIAGASVGSIILFALGITLVRAVISHFWPHREPWLGQLADSMAWAAIVVFLLLRPFAMQTFRIPSQSMENTLLVNDFIVANKAVYRIRPPHSDEIVVFRGPNAALQANQAPGKTYFIKRCIGTPGDVITIRKNTLGVPVLYRNDKPVTEPYAVRPTVSSRGVMDFKIVDGRCVQYEGESVFLSPIDNNPADIPPHGGAEETPTDPSEIRRILNARPEPVPPGMFLMMGDNRPDSYDSRFWGFVPRDRIMGRAEAIWMPITRIGRVH